MRLILAIFIPWLAFFTMGRPFTGLLCLLLQISLIGWIPAALWAVYSLASFNAKKDLEDALRRRNL